MNIMSETDIKIKLDELSLAEVNAILSGLSRMPYGEVFQLVAKIQEQATSQVQQERGVQENHITE